MKKILPVFGKAKQPKSLFPGPGRMPAQRRRCKSAPLTERTCGERRRKDCEKRIFFSCNVRSFPYTQFHLSFATDRKRRGRRLRMADVCRSAQA